MPSTVPLPFPRGTAVVAFSHDFAEGTTTIGIVLHVTHRSGRRGPVTLQTTETYDDVPSGNAEAFVVLRALEIARDHGFPVINVRAPLSRALRGPIAPSATDDPVCTGDLVARWAHVARAFAHARTQFVERRKNLEARLLVRSAAQPRQRLRRPDLFPAGPIPPRPKLQRRIASSWDELDYEVNGDGGAGDEDAEIPF